MEGVDDDARALLLPLRRLRLRQLLRREDVGVAREKRRRHRLRRKSAIFLKRELRKKPAMTGMKADEGPGRVFQKKARQAEAATRKESVNGKNADRAMTATNW